MMSQNDGKAEYYVFQVNQERLGAGGRAYAGFRRVDGRYGKVWGGEESAESGGAVVAWDNLGGRGRGRSEQQSQIARGDARAVTKERIQRKRHEGGIGGD